MILLKKIENLHVRFLSLKSDSKIVLIFSFLFLFSIFDISKAETNLPNTKNNQIEIEYLESKNELEDYIIDSGDSISLEFYPADEFSGVFPVNEEGEILLPRLDETFVRGLTTSELKKLLEKRYAEFLIDPDIKVRIAVFKSIRVLVRGELRNPGFYKFPSYKSVLITTDSESLNSNDDRFNRKNDGQLEISQNSKVNNLSSNNLIVKRSSENITTISDVIRKAGGVTSFTDLSRIEIIRDIPIGKGGGKKKAIIDFNSYINSLDPSNDIRVYDGDSLFFHKLSRAEKNQIPKSIISGISPKFISVNILGKIENPGVVKLPLEAVLSDAIDLTGPIKPLSGKIVLIRYEQDGNIVKKKISFSSKAKRGSKRNPYLKDDDLISVTNSIFGKTTGFISEVTSPFVGIYSTKQLIEGLSD